MVLVPLQVGACIIDQIGLKIRFPITWLRNCEAFFYIHLLTKIEFSLTPIHIKKKKIILNQKEYTEIMNKILKISKNKSVSIDERIFLRGFLTNMQIFST